MVEEEDEIENEDDDNGDNDLARRASRSESKLSTVASEMQRLIEPITEFQEYNTAPTPSIIKKTPPHLTSSQLMSQILPDDKHRVGNYITYEQRRTKMHKNRTASCSSSETSDDDTDGRKKRGSSKSLASFKGNDKDPDGDGMGNTGGQASEPSLDQDGNNREGDSNKTEKSNNYSSVPGKRHSINATSRSRRGRSVETRLRESQSLNRITEVQEFETNSSNMVHTSNHFNMKSDQVTKLFFYKFINCRNFCWMA